MREGRGRMMVGRRAFSFYAVVWDEIGNAGMRSMVQGVMLGEGASGHACFWEMRGEITVERHGWVYDVIVLTRGGMNTIHAAI